MKAENKKMTSSVLKLLTPHLVGKNAKIKFYLDKDKRLGLKAENMGDRTIILMALAIFEEIYLNVLSDEAKDEDLKELVKCVLEELGIIEPTIKIRKSRKTIKYKKLEEISVEDMKTAIKKSKQNFDDMLELLETLIKGYNGLVDTLNEYCDLLNAEGIKND